MERGPNAGMFHGRGAPDERGELIMIAEGTTPAAEGFAGHVVSAAGHLWGELDLSLTGALRRVVAEAERNVDDWNRKSIAQHRVALGVTCVARRGDQAVIAQAGPSIAFHASAAGIRIIQPEEKHAKPIGEGPDAVEATLARANLAPGDRLLILSTAALTMLEDGLIADILRLPAEQVLPELYQRLRELRHVTVFMLTAPVTDAAPAPPPLADEHESPSTLAPGEPLIGGDSLHTESGLRRVPAGLFQPTLFIDGGDEESHLDQARKKIGHVNLESRRVTAPPHEQPLQMEPLRKASGDDTLGRIASEHSASAAVSRSRADVARDAARTSRASHDRWRNPPQETSPQEDIARPRVAEARAAAPPPMANGEAPPPNGRVVTRNPSFSRGLAAGTQPSRPPPPPPNGAPLVSDLADGRRAESASYQAAAGSLADMIAADSAPTSQNAAPLVRPRANMGARWKSSSPRRQVGGAHGPPTWMVIAGGLAVLVAVLGWLVIPGMMGEQDGEREARLVNSAQELFSNAVVQQDPAMRRQSLNDAQGLLLQAQNIDPDDSVTAGLLDEVRASIAAMDAIVTPASVQPIGSLAQVGDTPVAISKLTVSDTQAYILDTQAQHVVVTDLASGSSEIIFDAAAGEYPAPVAVEYAELVDLGAGRLLIADALGGLWAYSPLGGIEQLAFAAPAGMTITDIAVYDNRLFVLDAADGAILEFIATNGGFASEPVVALEGSDLSNARHLMADGELITVDADGSVHRFSGEIAVVMSQSGIDQPLAAAKSANAFSDAGEIAIVDASSDRVVILNRDGTFARQYRHSDFERITALAMRDGVGYVVSGGELRRVNW